LAAQVQGPSDVEAHAEYLRLTRLCARMTGDPTAAEDLAQETLIAAWQSADRLRDPARRAQWLAGIARNLCRRWARSRARQPPGFGHDYLPDVRADRAGSVSPSCADAVAVELERHDLAVLLDRALAMLPPLTRAVLIGRYIEDAPHAEIAARLGLSEGAVAMRLQRGKFHLRRLLDGDLRSDCEGYRSAGGNADTWQKTPIWCTTCARNRLIGRFTTGPHGSFELRCPTCSEVPQTVVTNANHGDVDRLLGGVQKYKPAISRLMAWTHRFYRDALATRHATCPHCGGAVPLQIGIPPAHSPWQDREWRFRLRCPACGWWGTLSLPALVQALPECRAFWQAHPRMVVHPERAVEVDGRAAGVIRLASATDGARLDVISARDTFAVLAIHGTGHG